MKLQLDMPGRHNMVTGYGDGYIVINQLRHEQNLLLMPDRLVTGWATGGFAALSADDFAQICELAPELLLVGTGRRQRFPSPALLRPLIEAGIGHEVMDLAAACRTYNLLAAEGRRVAAALMAD